MPLQDAVALSNTMLKAYKSMRLHNLQTSKFTTMTYYIYQRSAYGFVKQLGFAFDKSQAIEKAKRYATNLYGDFAIEVHANGVKSEKVFDSKLWFNI